MECPANAFGYVRSPEYLSLSFSSRQCCTHIGSDQPTTNPFLARIKFTCGLRCSSIIHDAKTLTCHSDIFLSPYHARRTSFTHLAVIVFIIGLAISCCSGEVSPSACCQVNRYQFRNVFHLYDPYRCGYNAR